MRKLLLITLSVLAYATTFAQKITTIAGGLGDGGLARNTPFFSPDATAVDDSGNIYIIDQYKHRIRKVTASTGIVSTVAGNGLQGYAGDGSAATSANLYVPTGIAIDDSGNIYISDSYNHRIRKVTASTGVISTVAGNGAQGSGGDGSAATSANLSRPSGVAVDGSGNIYIADRLNNKIRKVNASTGIISTVAGNGAQGSGGDGNVATSANLYFPTDVAVDSAGNIYIADANNNKIRKVNASTGIINTLAGNGTQSYGGDGFTATSASLYNPTGVAIDGAGNIYIADETNHRIRKVTASTGIISTVAGNGTAAYGGDDSAATSANLYFPSGVTVDSSGNIYIADANNNRIRKVTTSTGIISTVVGNGRGAYGGDGSIATLANLYNPTGVSVDGLGNIYIADYGNHTIRKVTISTGIISTVAGNGIGAYGGDGSAATSANLYNPTGVSVDGSGNIYIADNGNNRIRKITASTGIISTIAGNGAQGSGGDGSAATLANLNKPFGLTVDGIGNIYIADQNNHRIRKVTASTGIISTVAGNGTGAYGGDGGAATSANLYFPSGVAVDGSGNIYIADGINRIRKVTASTGIINRVAGNGTGAFGGDGSTAISASLNFPKGIALDVSGNIYIADYGNQRIRKVTVSTGIINTVAGNGILGFGGDDSSATSAKLNYPTGIAIDGLGNIYIVDQSNNRIRKVQIAIANNIISNSQTICAGSAPTILTGSTPIGGTGSYTFTWLSSTTNATNGFTVIPSTNTLNYSPGALTQNKWFRRYVVSGTFTDTSAAVAIILNTAIGNDSITSIAQTICWGSLPAPITATTATGGNGTTYKYKWLKSITSASTGFVNAGGNDSLQNFTSSALIQNTWFKRKVISGVCNADTSTAILVTVIPPIATNTITGTAQNICSGSIPSPIIATTATGGNGTNYTYKWLKSITSAITGFTNAGGNDSLQNFTSGSLTQNTWFKRIVSSGVCNADTTTTFLVTINSSIGNNTISGLAQTICSGSIPAPIIATTATGGNGTTYNYKWLKSTTSSTAGFANAGGNDSIQNFTSNAITQNTWFKRKVISGVCSADTTAALLVTVNPTSTSTNYINICPSALPYTWNSRTYNTSVTDTIHLTNAVGCDSVTILKLTVKTASNSTNNISICPNALPFTWNGKTYNANSTDTIYLTNSLGCDSVTILKLTVKPTSASTTITNICPSVLPYIWNGISYNTNKTDTVYLTNSEGCDSVTILKLTIKPTSASTSIISICPSALPYTWNGRSYNTNRTDTVYLTNSLGCDSITILKLTVKSSSSSINNLNICPSALPYSWNGLTFNAAGIQTKTGLTNTVGCDSSATLNLTVNPSPNTSNIVGLANAAKLDTASYSVNGLSGSVFNWNVSGATIQSGAGSNKIQVKWSTTGTQLVNVTETSNQGCIGVQKTLSVIVSPTIGMNELKANNQVNIYPNPFSETIHITLLNNLKLEKAIIYDLVGNEIIISNKNEIDASSLKSGIYLIMIVDNIGNSYSQKLVKN
ncbi:MAG: T9SS type A sorting domain-containing protein [Bacteroidia bacterium]